MQQVREPQSDELFEMANLFPRTTGLPMTVWVSPRGNTRHQVRVKLNMSPGDQMDRLKHGSRRSSTNSARHRRCRRMINEQCTHGCR
jgi:hypothetical protein